MQLVGGKLLFSDDFRLGADLKMLECTSFDRVLCLLVFFGTEEVFWLGFIASECQKASWIESAASTVLPIFTRSPHSSIHKFTAGDRHGLSMYCRVPTN